MSSACSAAGSDTMRNMWLTRWQSTKESSASALISLARARRSLATATRRAARADCGGGLLGERTSIIGDQASGCQVSGVGASGIRASLSCRASGIRYQNRGKNQLAALRYERDLGYRYQEAGYLRPES